MNFRPKIDLTHDSALRLGKIFLDILACTAAIVCSYLLRFPPHEAVHQALRDGHILIMLVGLQAIGFTLLGLYSAMWRYTGLYTLVKMSWVATISLLMVIAASYLAAEPGLPRSIVALDWFLVNFLCGGSRLAARKFHSVRTLRKRSETADQRVLIYGAGNAGELLLRCISIAADVHIRVSGFIDDDPGKTGLTIHGTPILGTGDNIGEIAQKHAVSDIIVAMPSLAGSQLRLLLDQVRRQTHGTVQVRLLPGVNQVANGLVSIDKIRKVEIADLLRRKPVALDRNSVNAMLGGKSVLVVGGGGSIGSELCRQIASFHPVQLVVVDSCELNIYKIEETLKQEFPQVSITCLVADAGNQPMMKRIFSQYRPQFVFHAAAYKHVPLMESNPWAAVMNNLRCTLTLADLSGPFGVQKFILISSDKAVRPTNVMGATKRICELIVLAYNRVSTTSFAAVRFGNVLGSSGSVIPRFAAQIARGEAVTVTHPEITRYFMLIPEAVELVLQAAAIGERGNIYVLDMGDPVKIADLAQTMIQLASPGNPADIRVIYTGLRPGEKLHEALYLEGDESATQVPNIMVLQPRPISDHTFLARTRDFADRACEFDHLQLLVWIKQFVPEFQPKLLEGRPVRIVEPSGAPVSSDGATLPALAEA